MLTGSTMAGMLDLEAEYNNRARVPEHPEIIAGWARSAAAYRDDTAARSVIDLAYGDGPRQRFDLFVPTGSSAGAVALFIHGGYWQALSKSSFSHMAAGPNAHGVTVAVAGYTLCPESTVGGIVDEMRACVSALVRRFDKPVVVYGHSAGGHLAAAMLATDWSALRQVCGFDPVAAAMPISGLFDLEPLTHTSINDKLGLTPDEARRQSPAEWAAPTGKRVVAIVGGTESSEYHRQTRTLVERWSAAGVFARAVETPGDNHFTVIGPLADPDSDMTRGLVALTQG